jgi:hypothetical protein
MPDYDDIERQDAAFEDHSRQDVVAAAKGKVKAPGMALIFLGVLALAFNLYGLATSESFGEQFDAQIEKMRTDPNIPDDQRQQQVEIMTKIRDVLVPIVGPLQGIAVVVALIIVVGGVKMMSLTGRGLSMAASILSMILIVNFCCILGLPIGLWAIITLSDPTVKAGYAAVARGSAGGYE